MSNKASHSSSTVPLILAIETATRAGSVAVSRGEIILAGRSGDATASHSTDLIENIDAVLKDAGVELPQVELFAAAIGPGSFTGLRIGLATVKSLAVSMSRSCIGIPTLAAIARASGATGHVAALLPAGRGEVFAQLFTIHDQLITSVEDPAHINPPAMLAKYGDYRQLTWAGEGAHAQLELLRSAAQANRIDLHVNTDGQNRDRWMLAPPAPRLAEAIAELALREWRKGHVIEPRDLRANYVRASDAELKSHV